MSITGPDVSHWQGNVDFTAVKAAGHPFAVLKASQGTTGVDPMFAVDRAAAHKAGLVAGMYHFAGAVSSDGLIHVGSSQAEAANYLRTIGRLGSGEFPVLDFEPTSPPPNPVAWCADWLGWIFGQTGVMPLIYMNQSTRDRYDWSPVVALGAQLWLAKYDGSYTDNPGSSGRWPRVAMEQYTDIGTVPGVPGLVDVNVFYGDLAALAALGRKPAPAPVPAPILTEDDMYFLARNSKGTVMLFGPGLCEWVSTDADNLALQARFGKPISLADDLFNRLMTASRATSSNTAALLAKLNPPPAAS